MHLSQWIAVTGALGSIGLILFLSARLKISLRRRLRKQRKACHV